MNNKYPLLRDPYESELEYFKKNPHVAGMATEDERVIFNPYSKVHPHGSDSIYKNESSRLFMKKNNYRPNYKLTKEQKKSFKGYGEKQDIRETIASRGYSNDKSSGDLTPEQIEFIKELANRMAREGR